MDALEFCIDYIKNWPKKYKKHKNAIKQAIKQQKPIIDRINSINTEREFYDFINEYPIIEYNDDENNIDFTIDDIFRVNILKRRFARAIYIADFQYVKKDDEYYVQYECDDVWTNMCVPYKVNVKSNVNIVECKIGDYAFKNADTCKNTINICHYEFCTPLMGFSDFKNKIHLTLKSDVEITEPIKIYIDGVVMYKYGVLNTIIFMRYYEIATAIANAPNIFCIPLDIKHDLAIEEQDDTYKSGSWFSLTQMLKVYRGYNTNYEHKEGQQASILKEARKTITPFIREFLDLLDMPSSLIDKYTDFCIYYYELSLIFNTLVIIIKEHDITQFTVNIKIVVV